MLWGADADEDVGVPTENFSPCLGVSVRGLRRRRCGGTAVGCFHMRKDVSPTHPHILQEYHIAVDDLRKRDLRERFSDSRFRVSLVDRTARSHQNRIP